MFAAIVNFVLALIDKIIPIGIAYQAGKFKKKSEMDEAKNEASKKADKLLHNITTRKHLRNWMSKLLKR